jgi:putative protease
MSSPVATTSRTPDVGRSPEILAPAGDAASLAAALAAGADAVYLGLDEGMNARARARNFPVAALGETAAQVHRAGARLYLTLNTVVFQDELPFVEGLVRAAAEAGVDGLIVQDPAVALLAREVAPGMEVHASTQMTISSPEAAGFAERLGVCRVVVPRELSTAEIQRFADGTSLELEVFVHGALCMSWSGQCLTSEAWGGRSANRGQCAQSCRLPYDLVVDGEVRDLGEVRYLLSPLDLAGVRALPALIAAGVASLKIEGRLKGPAYVATAVHTYRRWRDAILEGRADDVSVGDGVRADLGRLQVAYGRGFSDGFFAGSDHQHLVEGRFPKHRGVLVGEVVEVTRNAVRVVHATRPVTGGLALGDHAGPVGTSAVQLPGLPGQGAPASTRLEPTLPTLVPGCGVGFDTGAPEQEEPGGPLFSVETTGDGWWLGFGRPGPDLRRVQPGHKVWLTRDPRLVGETERLIAAGEPEGRLPLRLAVRGAPGQPLEVAWRGPKASWTNTSAMPLQAASGAGLDADVLLEKLGATGGTPWSVVDLDVSGLAPGVHLPVSALKAMRREALSALLDRELDAYRHPTGPSGAAGRVIAAALAQRPARPLAVPDRPVLEVLCRTEDQLRAVLAAGVQDVVLDWMELVGLEAAVTMARAAGARVVIATTRVQKPGEGGVDLRLLRLAPDGMLVRHWGGMVQAVARGEPGLAIHGDFSLNVTNAVTAHALLAEGCDTLTAAHDLDEQQLLALVAAVPKGRMAVVVHHHLSTFHTEHCVYAHTLSHGRDFRSCGRPCEVHRVALRDREGREHPVVVDVQCRNTVFNAAAQSAPHLAARLEAAGVRRFRVELVWETAAQTAVVVEAWRGLLDGRATPAQVLARVGAHEQYGVTAGTMSVLRRGEQVLTNNAATSRRNG